MVIILRGIPCSGKSTYTQEFLKDNPNYIVISNDIVRDMFHIPFYTNEDSHDYSLALLRVALEHNKNVIIDNSNIYDDTLLRYIEVINEYEEPHKLITLNISLEDALKRNKTRADHRTENNIIEAYSQLLKTKINDYTYE